MTETVELDKKIVERLLEMHFTANELLASVPDHYSQGSLPELFLELGAELEARTRETDKIQEKNPVIDQIITELQQTDETAETLEEMEQELFGDTY